MLELKGGESKWFRERSQEIANLNDGVGCLATHVVDSVLVTKPVGTLDLQRV